MVILPKKITDLFYNPKTDTISPLLQNIKDAHVEILKNTDLEKCTLSSKQANDEFKVRDFMIPDEGLPQESLAVLIAELFQGASRWHSPRVMYNVVPPPLISTVATKTFTSLYNPNLCLDTASGESLITEQKVIKAIAEYIGWDWQSAGGAFTWGGKATTMYGIKLGLKNCMPNSSAQGTQKDVVVFSTDSGHPCHTSNADWLGIGTDNVIRLKTNKDSRVDLSEMEIVVKGKIKKGKKVAAIIISGGTTNNMTCDPIKEVIKLRDKIVLDLNLDYKPHVHVDAVVAFPWIFFREYDFELNTLNIGKEALGRISKIIKDLRGLNSADSFGIDFHKMGFCPYISCVFMVKDKTLLYGDHSMQKWPFNYTIENSRSADGPNTAYIALNVLGVKGFQILVAHLTEMAVHLQDRIAETGYFKVINTTGLGTSVMFVPRIPDKVFINDPKTEAIIHNNYTSSFIKKNHQLGNSFYIDQMPGNSTGANPYPFNSLKAYIISPYSTIESNIEFVEFLVLLKKEIDSEFDFANTDIAPESELPHPLK